MARIVIPARAFEDKVVVGFLNAILNRIQAINDTGTLDWDSVGKSGSSLADLEQRLFSDLQLKPTTLAGYGITDAVPISRSVNTGTGLTGGGTLSADQLLSLANTAVTPGTYGSASAIPVITIDQQGRVTSATTASRGAFSAHKNGTAQTGVPSATYTKVTFGTEEFDRRSWWDAANSRFQPNEAGDYRFYASILWSAGLVDQQIAVTAVFKNGVRVKQSGIYASGTRGFSSVEAVVNLNGSTDYVEIYGFAGGAGTKDIDGDAQNTFVCGERV